MSKKIVNVLKTKVKGLKYQDLKAKDGSGINSGALTYLDLTRIYCGIIINNKNITSEFINELYSKHKNLISEGKDGQMNYRLFLETIFTEMFQYAGATVPNDLIIEELITNYNQAGYPGFFYFHYNELLGPFDLMACCSERISIHMECNDPNHLRCFSGTENIRISYCMSSNKLCDLSSSVEFELKYENGNVTYEDGKISLTIPKELENYKAGDDSLLDKLTDIINKIVEYLKKLCEKLGFKLDTKIEYNSEHNIRIERNLGKPLQVTSISTFNGLELRGR